MPSLGTLVFALSVLWGVIQLHPLISDKNGFVSGIQLGEMWLTSVTAFFLSLTALLIKRTFPFKRPIIYVQLVCLLVAATFSLVHQDNAPFGIALFLLVILLGFYYRVMGRNILVGLTVYFSTLIINYSYQRDSILDGVGTFVFLLLSYTILYLVYRGFFEREGSMNEKFAQIIEAQKQEIRDKEKMIDQMKPNHYYERDLNLTNAEKSLLDCIWLYREVGNKELSRLTGKSESTIRNRIFSICRKLGFDRRTKLLTFVLESPTDIEELPVVEDIFCG